MDQSRQGPLSDGVTPTVISSASITERVQLRTCRGEILDETSPADLGRRFGCPNLVVLRVDLLRALATEVGPDAVSLGARCVGYKQDTDGVAAHFADGTEWRGDVLIGADGLHSLVREQLFSKCRPRYAGYTCWRGLAEFEGEALPAGLEFEAWGRGVLRCPALRTGPCLLVRDAECSRGLARRTDWSEAGRARSFLGLALADPSSHRRNRRQGNPQERHHGTQSDQELEPGSGNPVERCGPPDDAQPWPRGVCQAIEDALVLADCWRPHLTSKPP
jgi:2-polyprenyl-6-methoxyphenol hydroxylase-like FAD-dependent oxidoreductase